MMLIGKPYTPPPPKFQPGDKVKFYLSDDEYETGIHTVVDSDHCFTWVEGRRFGIPNYRLKRVRKSKNSASVEIR